ncbi:MAG: DUF4442 domain-containing protein [Ornithinimicrobium sp.]
MTIQGLRAPTWQSLGGDHRVMRHFMNIWPPFAGSGIHIEQLGADFRTARVALHHRWWARNYVGTLFGGAIFAMTDPWWMVLVLRSLGPDYVVWDKAAEIEFVAPGRSTVRASYVVTDELLQELREAAAGGAKVLRWLETDVVTDDGTVVARVRKQLYVRERRKAAATGKA